MTIPKEWDVEAGPTAIAEPIDPAIAAMAEQKLDIWNPYG